MAETAIQKPCSATFVSSKCFFKNKVMFSGLHSVSTLHVTSLKLGLSNIALALPDDCLDIS